MLLCNKAVSYNERIYQEPDVEWWRCIGHPVVRFAFKRRQYDCAARDGKLYKRSFYHLLASLLIMSFYDFSLAEEAENNMV